MKKLKFIAIAMLVSVLCLTAVALADTYIDKTADDDALEPIKQAIERSYTKTEDFTIEERMEYYNDAKEDAQQYANEANAYVDELIEVKAQTGKEFDVPVKLEITEIKEIK